MKTFRRAGVIGVALGLGLMGAAPAMANSGWHHHRGADDNGAAWGLDVNGDDGPAWGLDTTWHGPAWGVPVSHDDGKIELPVVLDQEGPTAAENGSWANGVSSFGIDGATITGDNPVADAYLGNAGWNSLDGWTTDRRGWLGGLLGDEGWRVGGLW